MRRSASLISSIIVFAFACTGSDPDLESSSSSSGGTGDGGPNDGDAAATNGPPAPPASLSFWDDDMAAGRVHGNLVIGKAADETNVKEYVLYWGSDATTRTSELKRIVKVGNDVAIVLGETMPPGTTHLLAASANGAGELSASVALAKIDSISEHVQVTETLSTNQVAIESGGNIVIASTRAADKGLSVAMCNPSSLACPHSNLTSTELNAGEMPSIASDPTNSQIVITANRHNTYRCALDGTGCMSGFVTTPSGFPVESSYGPSGAVDKTNSRFWYAAFNADVTDVENFFKVALFRCAISFSNQCVGAYITEQTDAHHPTLLLDEPNEKLRVVYVKDGLPKLTVCNLVNGPLTGLTCAAVALQNAEKIADGSSPQAFVDTKSSKLLVIGESQTIGKPFLLRCELDGTGCTKSDLSAGQAQGSGRGARGVIDPVSGKLLVVAKNDSNGKKASLYRCDADGANCLHADISTGVTMSAGADSLWPVVSGGKLFVAAGPSVSLYRVTLAGN